MCCDGVTLMTRVEILSPYPPGISGGITTFSQNLKTAFEMRFGLDCSLATPLFGPLSGSRHPLATSGSLGLILLQLIRRKPQAVFVQGHAALLIPAIVYTRLFRGSTLVFTFHTEWGRMSDLKARIIKWLLSQCTALTFVSSYLAERMTRLLRLPTGDSRVILPGVAVEQPPSTEIAKISRLVEGRSPILSYIGKMTWKGKVEGLKVLISALAEVRHQWPEVLLLVAGDGPFEDEVHQFVSDLGLERHVSFLGNVQSPESCLRFSNLHVHISLRENLALAILEAMAVGVPVIASDTGAVREIVSDGQTGMLVRPEVADVSNGIVWLLSHPEIARAIGAAGKNSVLTKFSWSQAARDYLRISGTIPN